MFAKWIIQAWVVCLGLWCPYQTHCLNAGPYDVFHPLIGKQDAMLIADPQGTVLFAQNADKPLIPASTLKVFTSLVALYYLGDDHRFVTDFYRDFHGNLKIKGHGDPLLISEVVAEIAQSLRTRLHPSVTVSDLVLDDSYFSQPLTIPGITSSYQPYDAPNGALCVNFNTVYFRSSSNGYVSAEPQTPLLPLALKKIKTTGRKSGRILLAHTKKESTLYAGKLFEYFLKKQGIKTSGTVRLGKVDATRDKLVFSYHSGFALEQIIAKLLKYSNNFATNQLLITAGARAYGPPGNLDKGIKAALNYAKTRLHIDDWVIAEGSGISRRNRVTARHMHKVLEEFAPHHHLLRQDGREYYKTGTLSSINNRAGYIDTPEGLYRFVLFVNTPGKSTQPVMQKLLHILAQPPDSGNS
ncbi:MAG: D-alanyl-D-alanine carboxypeptidase [Desulfobacterales bacterium]|nr:MAG: D-alanyl-D-alanine carboxypeptidase [Desulfobacterales bacterium]